MAVGVPVGGTAAGANGGAVAPTLPASVAANDIIVLFAIFYNDGTGTVPTTITWPATYTQGNSATVKDASGNARGIAGWAWKRAAGGESGTVSISANGTASNTASGSLGNCCRIPGCTRTGNPWEDSQVNAPNYTATVDFPAASMTRSTGGLSR